MGVPGPYNWRGALFKNAMFTGSSLGDISFDMDWYQTPVEDQTSVNIVPEPVTTYYSYLGTSTVQQQQHLQQLRQQQRQQQLQQQ